MEVMMKRRNLVYLTVLFFVGSGLLVLSPDVRAEWPTSNYVTVYPSGGVAGTIPVVISVPHGGTKKLLSYYSICGDYNQDINTNDLGEALALAFEKRFPGAGPNPIPARPYIIYNQLKRQFFDANRDPGHNNREQVLYAIDNAGYTPDMDIAINPYDAFAYICTGSTNVWTAQVAKDAWYVFNTKINDAKAALINTFPQILYIDLHSFVDSSGDEPQIIQLGYGLLPELYSEQGISATKSQSSLRYLDSPLAQDNQVDFVKLIRGNASFGAMLNTKAGVYYSTYHDEPNIHEYKSSPSPALPVPAPSSYGGGFNTYYQTIVDYRCARIENSYDYEDCDEETSVPGHTHTSGLQIEIPRDYIKDTYDGAVGRKHLSRVLVDTIAAYLTAHYGYTLDGTGDSNIERAGTDTVWPEY